MKIDIMVVVILIAVAGGIGYFVGNLLRKRYSDSLMARAEELADKIVEDAKRQAENSAKEATLQAKDVVYQAKADFERESKEMRSDLVALEKRLQQKDEHLENKMNLFDQRDAELVKKEQAVVTREQSLTAKEQKIGELHEQARQKLEEVSGMTASEAKQILMDNMIDEAKFDVAKRIRVIEEEARETADKKSKEILALAIQRYAGEYVAERTVSVVALPSSHAHAEHHAAGDERASARRSIL